MSLDWTGWQQGRSINARSFLLAGILEAVAAPALLLLAFLLRDLRLALFAALFAQGLIVMAILYARTRLLDRLHQCEREEYLTSMLRRAPI